MLHHHRPTTSQTWFKLDTPLFLAISVLIGFGLFMLYSAGNGDWIFIKRQSLNALLAFAAMLVCAQIPPRKYRIWAPWLFSLAFMLLVIVLLVGSRSKGAERWLNLGFFKFQPSELMKLAMPMVLAWYFRERPLPPKIIDFGAIAVLIALPTLLVMKQPDLGTAIMIAASGCCVLLLIGIPWRYIGIACLIALIFLPIAWHFMHTYQQQRVLTFLNPERDPLGTGYHIIQSKIAIGSGGLFGKGWMQTTQSRLHFLPEHHTDFIFAVCGESFGFIGCLFLLFAYATVLFRCVFISLNAQDTFTRILSGSLTLTFFVLMFVNMGMVTGIFPVVGIPLPLISYGGTSMVTLLIGFGMLMSIQSHRQLITT
ncbi:MAG: rod shape-determining protein RodA [marine bacterium B5-7]|nr:MAG: rod shape-determining protein RodA [marine bacterium B5-7]